jgi:hypothetical protein
MSYGQYSENHRGRIDHDRPRKSRVKQVVDTDTVAHLWAHQTQDHARNKLGNFYYDGATIYSYGRHFPIARITTDATGARCVLFTSRDYSMTTAKQKHIARMACSHLALYTVEHPDTEPCAADHDAMVRKASEAADKATRARKRADWHLSEAKCWIDQANEFNRAFNLGLPHIDLAFLGEHLAQIEERIEAERARQESERRAQARIAAQENRERLRAWLRGDSIHPPRTLRPMVRVNGDMVETTWGASVPLADAQFTYNVAKACAAKGKTYTTGSIGNRAGTLASLYHNAGKVGDYGVSLD